jgi:hypothetical protein
MTLCCQQRSSQHTVPRTSNCHHYSTIQYPRTCGLRGRRLFLYRGLSLALLPLFLWGLGWLLVPRLRAVLRRRRGLRQRGHGAIGGPGSLLLRAGLAGATAAVGIGQRAGLLLVGDLCCSVLVNTGTRLRKR